MKTIIEVGANDGTDTQKFLTQDDMVVYAFEPTHELLGKLYDKFRNEPRVKIIPMAVELEPGFANFNIAS